MANAGRILIIPKGGYNEEYEYEMLDMVRHNNTAWVAKKSAQGIEPSDENEEYWFRMGDVTKVVDNLLSESADMALSANQGRVLSESLTWKLLATKQGATELTLPDIYNELYIKCNVFDNIILHFNAPRVALSDTTADKYRESYNESATKFRLAEFTVTKSKVALEYASKDGTDITTNTYWVVYYR